MGQRSISIALSVSGGPPVGIHHHRGMNLGWLVLYTTKRPGRFVTIKIVTGLWSTATQALSAAENGRVSRHSPKTSHNVPGFHDQVVQAVFYQMAASEEEPGSCVDED